jgi:hypothetical protein
VLVAAAEALTIVDVVKILERVAVPFVYRAVVVYCIGYGVGTVTLEAVLVMVNKAVLRPNPAADPPATGAGEPLPGADAPAPEFGELFDPEAGVETGSTMV